MRIAQEEQERESFSVYAPDVIRLGTGGYRMYYSAWGAGVEGGAAGGFKTIAAGSQAVFSLHVQRMASSGRKRKLPTANCCAASTSPTMMPTPWAPAWSPSVFVMPDGRTRMLYECCNSAYHRPAQPPSDGRLTNTPSAVEEFAILSATTPANKPARAAM